MEGKGNMERLTKLNKNKTAYIYPECLEICGGTGYSSYCDDCNVMDKICDKLGKYEDLEEQGRLLKLDDKYQKFVIGQEVWIIISDSIVEQGRISRICETWSDLYGFQGEYTAIPEKGRGGWDFKYTDLGKTIFLTKEESKAALKELKDG